MRKKRYHYQMGSFQTQDVGPTVVWTPPWLEEEAPTESFEDPTQEFVPVMTHAEAVNAAQAGAMTHARPLSQQEITKLEKALNTGYDVNGAPITKYQEVAIAQFIYENMLNFSPDIEMTYGIKEKLQDIEKVDMIFSSLYQDYLDNLRKTVTESTAEDMSQLYTIQEKARLKNQGVAFTEQPGTTEEEIEQVEKAEKKIQQQKINAAQYAHPMLRYGLIK